MKKPISTNKAPSAIGPYSQAIQWGDVVFISGQVAFIPSTGELNNNTFENDAICKEAGGSLDHILKLSIFLTDLSNFDTVNNLMKERFSEPFPARSTIEVSRLPKDVNIEMDAILSIEV
jgi:reactive intermediate/imine deaminase